MNLENKIEAILFWKGEPLSIKRLADILKKDPAEIEAALTTLERRLETGGLVLMRKEDEVMLGTAPALSKMIEDLAKEELTKDLGRAGLETLSVILYKGPITRREIDFIRGVNSTFILRHLLIRGLVEKITNPKDERSFLYKPTFELLSYLGASRLESIPNYQEVLTQLNDFQKAEEKSEVESEGETTSEPSEENLEPVQNE
ncbi:MAG TPA: SMC-Scp complex subunit ScpB [Candidatus Paceibacterota bacterium]|nr:SMC-Scp complex subunit ScpB [Candidatus Paceibacterota bacterium]